jgi:hypothetical protein
VGLSYLKTKIRELFRTQSLGLVRAYGQRQGGLGRWCARAGVAGRALVWAAVARADGGGGVRACGFYPYRFRVDLVGSGERR